MSNKQLHRHTTPIIMLGVAVFMLAIAYGFYIGHPGNSYQDSLTGAGKALTSSAIQIKPTKNGWARVSLSNNAAAVAAAKPGGQVLNAGRSAANSVLDGSTAIQQMGNRLNTQQ